MRKTFLVAFHQFKQAVWQWPFILSLVIGPPLVVGLFMLLNFLFNWDPTDTMLAIFRPTTAPVSRNNSIERALGYVDEAGIIDAPSSTLPPVQFVAFPDELAAQRALAANQISGYYVIPRDYVSDGNVNYYGPTTRASATDDQLIQEILMFNLAGGDKDPRAQRLLYPLPPDSTPSTLPQTLARFMGFNLNENAMTGLTIAGFFFAVLTFAGLSLLSPLALEKERQILEILLTSVSPRQLLAGKLVGNTAICLLQVTSWLIWARIFGGSSGLLARTEPPTLVLAGLVLLGGFFAYAAMLLVVGVLSQSSQESELVTLLFALGAFFPLLWLPEILTHPDGAIATGLSLIPLSAPTIMILRLFIGPVPAWQIVASLGLFMAWTGLMLWLAGRVFRAEIVIPGRDWSARRKSQLQKILLGISLTVWLLTALYFLFVPTAQRVGWLPLFVFLESGLVTILGMLAARHFFASWRGLILMAGLHLLAQLWLQWQWNLWDSPNYLLHNLNALAGLVAADSFLGILVSVTLLLILRDISVLALAVAWVGIPLSLLAMASLHQTSAQLNNLPLRESLLFAVPLGLLEFLAVAGILGFLGHTGVLIFKELSGQDTL